ncbi:MAG: DUF7133 domain-containing protein [Fimbriiglobus sp.]
MRGWLVAGVAVALAAMVLAVQPPAVEYAKKANRVETIVANLRSHQLPTLAGDWFFAGPFPYDGDEAFDKALPPDQATDLKGTFTGLGGVNVEWKKYAGFRLGGVLDLKKIMPAAAHSDAAIYLAHEFVVPKAMTLPISLGSDDTLSVFLNGKRLLHENHVRPAAADQDRVDLKLVAGKNLLIIKIGQHGGGWEAYVAPEIPSELPATIAKRIDRDFPPAEVLQSPKSYANAEAKYYTVETFTTPENCVLEVGGLGFRPDGKLLACTRRGEVWLIDNPTSPTNAKFTLFASGLHEALGFHVVDNNTIILAQRPELTKITDSNGDGVADQFTTICDKWGVSGDYHEYAFGPAVDKDGNFFLTLNVGFGGGHQAKAAFRGWCVKVSPKGDMEPWAYGLRSPNGINFSPEGELFYADNQGEWVATNKLHHLKRGKFYGHQAGLKWVKDSPFEGKVKDTVASGMLYDGTNPKDPMAAKVFPEVDPPVIWFPYGRMGQSVTEPRWDTTAGKFGPFAGQCFLGDQTRSMVMRVAMEKVNGVYQGACFPFRAGLQCGVNRIVFGPDGALYAGQTNRGWGSTGGKPYGLQRIQFSGNMPPEIHHVSLTTTGFDLTFTEPLDPATLQGPSSLAVKSFTYAYSSQYGYPETDTVAEKVQTAKLSADGKTCSLVVPNLRKGRVYDIQLPGVKTKTGEPLLHPEAYYTLNELVK